MRAHLDADIAGLCQCQLCMVLAKAHLEHGSQEALVRNPPHGRLLRR
jgi:hypothetical protein